MRLPPLLRGLLALLLIIAWCFDWGRMAYAGYHNIVIEPTVEAVQQAAASLPQGYLGAAIVVSVGMVSAALFRRRWLLVTALPGIAVGGVLPTAPGNGLGALLLSSFVVLGVVVWRVMHRWLHATSTDV